MIPEDRLRVLFALLFSSPESVTLERIRQVLYPSAAVKLGTPAASKLNAEEGCDVPLEASNSTGAKSAESAAEMPIEAAVEHFSPRDHLHALEAWMEERQLPLTLHQVGRSWRLLTSEDLAEDLMTLRKATTKEKLGPASLEVLALVAYRQPVLKADIDAIRGVKSGSHLRHLLDLRLVKILGRAELPGRPFLYGTTKEFLDRFGLRDLEDLPEAGRLASPAEQGVVIAPESPQSPVSEPGAAAGSESESPIVDSSTGK